MATRIPLVIVDGVVQQLPGADSIAGIGPETTDLQNSNAGSAVIGMAVYSDGAGTFDLALADAAATYLVVGLVYDATILTSATGSIQTDGIVTATTGQWDAVAGTTGGLTPGTRYYLSPGTEGELTETATITTTEYVVPIGRAISATEMTLNIETSVLL